MIGILRWLVRRVGARTLLILALFFVAMASMVWTLSAIVRGLDLDLLITLTLAGAAVGWLLARSSVPGFAAPALILVAALGTAWVRVGQLGGRFVALVIALLRTLADAQFGQFHTRAVSEAWESLAGGILALGTRVQEWSAALASGQSSYDPVASALVWSFAVFLLAAWTAWMLRREERAFDSMLPLVLLLALLGAYSGRGAWVIFAVLGAWLGLMVAVPFLARQRRWEQDAVAFAQDLGFDLALVTVPAIALILAVAVFTPVFSPREIAQWARGWTDTGPATSQLISNSFGVEPAPASRPGTALDRQSSPGLPRSHLVGASPELLGKLALTVQTDDPPEEFPARYWLGTTYDEYSGHGWSTGSFRLQVYRAGERALEDTPAPDRIAHQTVRAENLSGIVFAAGMVKSVDRDFQIAWRAPGDMFGAQVDADSYRVESIVSFPGATMLRGAGQAYPDQIRSQYLRVPDNMPPRVLALARDLTAAEPTPYDRALAIEAYLQTIPYSLDVPAPPGDRDVVDYFIFELRRGYCDYYATAMAMLARAAGLPARLAVGYAAGEFDPATHTYRVTEANAHSWTQIYFPKYGWVDFEPTNGRAPITRDATISSASAPADLHSTGPNSFRELAQSAMENNRLVAPWIFLLFGMAGLLLLVADTLYLRRATPPGMLTILYARIIWCARRLGLPVQSSHTPNQVVALLDAYFGARSASRYLTLLWRPIPPVVQWIVADYMNTTYGAHELSETEKTIVIQRWQAVRVQLMLVVILLCLIRIGGRLQIPTRGRSNITPLPHKELQSVDEFPV